MTSETPPTEPSGPAIGADEWVARSDERAEARRGIVGRLQAWYERIPRRAVFAFFVVAAALVPVLTAQTDNDIYFLRVCTVALVFALLALYVLLLERERPPGAARLCGALALFALWANLHSLFAIGLGGVLALRPASKTTPDPYGVTGDVEQDRVAVLRSLELEQLGVEPK